ATDGHSFRHLAAEMTGATQENYAAMMLAGGRSVEGNRSKTGRETPSAFIAEGGAKPKRAKAAKTKSAKAKAAKPAAKSKASAKSKSKAKSSSKARSKRG